MLRLEDENQINDDVQPAGDDTQQAPQADEGIVGGEETADEGTVKEGAVEEKTEEENVEGGAEETNI
jgi:hypothetical protein